MGQHAYLEQGHLRFRPGWQQCGEASEGKQPAGRFRRKQGSEFEQGCLYVYLGIPVWYSVRTGKDRLLLQQEALEHASDLVQRTFCSGFKAFIDSGAPSQIIDGSAAIAVGYDYDYAYAAPESEDIGWIAPSEGCPGYLDGWVPLAGSKNLDAVYQFFNFHLEDENYADFINTTMASWIIPEVKSLLDPDVANCEALDPEKNPGTFYTQTDADKTAQYAAAWQAIQNA